MKVIQINCVYKKGSTGKIVYDLHREYLKRGIDSQVFYGRGEKITEPGVYKFCTETESYATHFASKITGYLYGGCFFSTRALEKRIEAEQPDVVHLQCINGYSVNIYHLLNWLKVHHVKTVATLHAEFMYTGGCGHSIDCNQWSTRTGCGHSKNDGGCPRRHEDIDSWFFDRTPDMWRKMRDAFTGFRKEDLIITSVSPWLMGRAKQSPFLKEYRHETVLNGLDTRIFHCRPSNTIREKLGLSDSKVIVHVTSGFSADPNNIKHGDLLVRLAGELSNNIYIVVVGNNNYEGDLPSNIICAGPVADQQQLAEYYSMADLTLLTSERETYSMVVAESLCSGTPVVGFRAGGPESIGLDDYCRWADFGDVDALRESVLNVLDTTWNREAIQTEAAARYDKSVMAEGYLNIYQQLVESAE